MKKFVYIALIFMLSFFILNNALIDQYIAKLKGDTNVVSLTRDTLYEEIVSKAKEYEVPPSDAKIDPIWKAIPGYNGVKINIEASYKRMKKDGKFKEERLVFEQIKPKIHLTDLQPAPIYKGHPDKPMVSFIINVAWGNEYLSSMLETLKKHHVQATFFLEGRWVKNHPDLALMIASQGHEIGNHSYTHPDMKQLSATKIRQEIQKTEEVIKATIGKSSSWFAPPSGSFRDEVVKIAYEENLGTILWSVDTIDWRNPPPEELIARVMTKIHNGAIILMHPTESTSLALDELIKQIKDKGFEINTISQLLSEKRIIKTARE